MSLPSRLAAGQPPPLPARSASGAVTVAIAAGMVVVAAVQVWAGWRGGAVGWLAIGPLLGSLLVGWRSTAALGGAAIALALELAVAHPSHTRTADAVRLAVVLSLSGFAVLNGVLRQRRDAHLLRIREIARVAQGAILRPVPARIGRMRFAARYQSAAQGARVGGDLLDVLEGPDGIRVIVGDVCGKGLPAVRLASLVLAGFRHAARRAGLSLAEVARSVDHAVRPEVGEEGFVTAVFLHVDQQGGWRRSTAGTRPRCGWAATANSGCWSRRASPPHWACRRGCAWTATRSDLATACWCTPMACWRHVTLGAAASCCGSTWTCSAAPAWRTRWKACCGGWWRTVASACATTSRCC